MLCWIIKVATLHCQLSKRAFCQLNAIKDGFVGGAVQVRDPNVSTVRTTSSKPQCLQRRL